jgi:hypothetical protein
MSFPPKSDPFKNALVIYSGHTVSIGIQLVVDSVWRYKLQSTEQLTVQLRKADDTVVLEKVFTSADVDDEDKIVNVTLDGEDTNLPDGHYYLCAFVDDYVIFDAQPVVIRKVVAANG